MKINQQDMVEFAEIVATAVVSALKKEGIVGKAKSDIKDKSVYQRTEQLLYRYNDFKKIIKTAAEDIENLRKYGVPQKDGSIVSYGGHSGLPQGIVLEEESVEDAVRTVQANVQGTVHAVRLIDKGLEALKRDPYYKILEMRYFEGRTQEDIAVEFKCDQRTIGRNKSRLVNELALQLFPNEMINEYLH